METMGAILAAGYGTRLRPLTHHLPKPLVPVAGRPLLAYGLDALAGLGIGTVGINAFHLASALRAGLADRREALHIVEEETLQGTGGGIRGIAAALPRGTLVVINGDALFDFDLAPILARHRARGAMATLVLRAVPADAPFGRVGVDQGGRLHRIAEISGPDADRRTLRIGAYTGIQIVEPALIEAIPPGPCDILRSAYARRIAERAPLYGDFAREDGVWLDVGNPARYLAAHRAFLDGRLPAPHLPPPDEAGRRIAADAEIAADVEIEGEVAVLPGARIGRGARLGRGTFVDRGAAVAPGAALERTVVWPGALARGTLCDTVVLPDAAPEGGR